METRPGRTRACVENKATAGLWEPMGAGGDPQPISVMFRFSINNRNRPREVQRPPPRRANE